MGIVASIPKEFQYFVDIYLYFGFINVAPFYCSDVDMVHVNFIG